MFTHRGALTPTQREQQQDAILRIDDVELPYHPLRQSDLTAIEQEMNRARLFGQDTRANVRIRYEAAGLEEALRMISAVQAGQDRAMALYKGGIVDACPECGIHAIPCACPQTLAQLAEYDRMQAYTARKQAMRAELEEEEDATFAEQQAIDATWRKFIKIAPFVFAACMLAGLVGRLLWVWLH